MTLFWRAAPIVFLILWSGGYGFAKLGFEYAEPMTLLALRYGLAMAVLAPLALVMRPHWPEGAGQWTAVAVTGFLIQGVYFGLAYLAMKQGMNAGTTAIIMALQPALVATASPLIGGKRGGSLLWLGLGTGFCGVLLAVVSEGSLGPSPLGAALLAVGAHAGISGATLFEKAQGRKTDPVAGGAGAICSRFRADRTRGHGNRKHDSRLATRPDRGAGLAGLGQLVDLDFAVYRHDRARRCHSDISTNVSCATACHGHGLGPSGRADSPYGAGRAGFVGARCLYRDAPDQMRPQ